MFYICLQNFECFRLVAHESCYIYKQLIFARDIKMVCKTEQNAAFFQFNAEIKFVEMRCPR